MTNRKKAALTGQELLALCCKTLDEIKAEDIVALDVRGLSTITNYLVLATAKAEPHLRAMKRDLDKSLKEHNVKILGAEEGQESGWSVVDAFDVMIHLFSSETRETYKLETLWKDAVKLDVERILAGNAGN